MISKLFETVTLEHGPAWKNRLTLAPLTNSQSHDDGTLSDEELHWLSVRAQGGFSNILTCASHVQAVGQGFPGQLGIFGDEHLEGLTRLAAELHKHGAVTGVQIHHAGIRAPKELVGTPVGPSDDAETGARALTEDEVEQAIQDFITAAKRAAKAGFDSVQIHGAHGYLLAQFLSPELNRRTDRFGGSLENRARPLRAVIDGVRKETGPNFQVGLRLSPERFGLVTGEIIELTQQLLSEGQIDYLDLSLWDAHKEPEDKSYAGKTLISLFTPLNRGKVRLGVAGKLYSAADVLQVVEEGADFVSLGKAGVMHADFPKRVAEDPQFKIVETPVTAEYLATQGISPKFVGYLRKRPNWVID